MLDGAAAWPRLVPEGVGSGLARSPGVWRGPIGFQVRYNRPEERDTSSRGPLSAPSAPPLGIGMNLAIAVRDAGPLLRRLEVAGSPLLFLSEHKRHRVGYQRSKLLTAGKREGAPPLVRRYPSKARQHFRRLV